MCANVQRWVILLEYFCFCPNFLWNPGFPVHKKFYFEVATWVEEVVLKPWCRVFSNGVCYPQALVTEIGIPLTSFSDFFFFFPPKVC